MGFAIIAIACNNACWNGLGGGMSNGATTTWPIASLENQFPTWPIWRLRDLTMWREARLAIYSLDEDGRPVGAFSIVPLGQFHAIADVRMTSDASRFVRLEFCKQSGWQHVAIVHDRASHSTRRVTFAKNSDGFFQLGPIAPDGKSVLVIQTLLPTQGTGGENTHLHSLDLDTGLLRQIAAANIPSVGAGGAQVGYSTPRMSAALGSTPELPWVIVAYDYNRSPWNAATQSVSSESIVAIGSSSGEHRVTIAGDWSGRGQDRSVQITPAEMIIVDGVTEIDPRTDIVSHINAHHIDAFPSDRPSIAQLMSSAGYCTPTSNPPIALLDVQPHSFGLGVRCPFNQKRGAYRAESGICAIEFGGAQYGAVTDAPVSIMIWRVPK